MVLRKKSEREGERESGNWGRGKNRREDTLELRREKRKKFTDPTS